MSIRLGITAAAVLTLVVAVSSALAHAGDGPRVRSSLDHLTRLPHRVHWLAYPSVPKAQVKEVDFLIDGGPVRWVEKNPPYSFSDDGGYLVTSWLTPGRHRFTVRVLTKDGRVGSETATALVAAPPAVPTALAGTWTRQVTGSTEPGWPNGTYRLRFDRRWIELDHPGPFDPVKSVPTGDGYINYLDWTAGKNRFHVQSSVTLKTQGPKDRVGGWLCEPGGPGTEYSWSVTADTLTLRPTGGADTCPIRGFVWSGQWTKEK